MTKRSRQLPVVTAGFTVLELLVVMAVLALVSGVAFPMLGQALTNMQFGMAEAMVQGATRAARAEAMRNDLPVALAASTDGRFLLGNGRIIADLPPTVRLQSNGASPRFFGDGSASGGALDLVSQRKRAELVIADGSGLVRWQS